MEVKDKRAAEWNDRCLKDELTEGRLTGYRISLPTIIRSQILAWSSQKRNEMLHRTLDANYIVR